MKIRGTKADKVRPTVVWLSPKPNEQIPGTGSIKVSVRVTDNRANNINQVKISIDTVEVGIAPLDNAAGANVYSLTLPASTYAGQTIELSMEATVLNGPARTSTLGTVAITSGGVEPPPPVLPTSGFTAAPLTGVEPVSVVVTDASSNASQWLYQVKNASDVIVASSTQQNPIFSLPAGVYSITQVVTNGAGSAAPFTRTDYVTVTAQPVNQEFVQITTLRSSGSGEHWVSPFGIPANLGAVPSTKKHKMVARYPNNSGGTLYPVQIDNELSWNADGSLRHCAGHVKLPVGYVAQDKVGIGYSDTYVFGSAPDWAAVTTNYASTFQAKLSVYNFKTLLVHFLGNGSQNSGPRPGDEITIAITDTIGTQTYTLKMNNGDYHALVPVPQMIFTLMRMITQDPAGRYKCYENMPAKPLAFDVRKNNPQDPNAGFGQYGHQSRRAKITQNASMSTGIGNWTNAGWSAPFVPAGWAAQYPGGVEGGAFMIWPRWHSGNPENFSATCTITAKGRAIKTSNTSFSVGRKFAYSGLTGTITAGQTATFASGATAIITAKTGTHVLLESINEIAGAITGTFTTATASATIGAESGHQIITGATSGATAKLISKYVYIGVNHYHIIDVTGTFQAGETITGDFDGSATLTEVPDAISAWKFYSGPSDTAGSSTGTLPTILAPSNRVVYTADWANGTEVPLSPYFGYDATHGRQVKQVIRKVPLKDPGNVNHPHLNARMVISYDNTGAQIDHQVTIESPLMHAWATDHIYDCTEINVGGVNQISAILDDYKQLIHVPWAQWRWRKTKARGLCDPVHFMANRLIPTWRRDPTRDMRMGFRAFTRGHDTWGDNTNGGSEAEVLAGPRGGWSKAKTNLPLYAGPWKFEASGGASPSIGVYSFWEWAFWHGNVFQTWDEMEAACDNNWGAFPFWCRDEANDSEAEDSCPHIFKRWYTASYASRPAPDGNKIKIACNEYEHTALYSNANPRTWSFWPGCSNGGYGFTRVISPSHSPHYPGRSMYLACPEYTFNDMNERFGWFMGTNRPQTEAVYGYSNPKTGGVAGDADHQLAFSTYNGNRTFAWEWRSIIMGAATAFDRHPRKAMWRRAAQSFAGHFGYNVSRHWQGMYHTRISQGSDNYRTGIMTMLAGEPVRAGNDGNTIQAPGSGAGMFDMFKGSYVYNTAIAAMDLEVADCSEGLNYGEGYLKMVTDLPPDKWWCFQKLSFTYFALPDGPSSQVDTDQLVFPTNDWNVVRGYWEDPTKLNSNFHKDAAGGAFNRQYVTSPQPSFYEAGSGFSVGSQSPLFTQNYPMYRFYVNVYQGLARHMTDPAKRATANSICSLLDGYIPPSTIDSAGWALQGERYDYIWGMWGMLRPGEYSTEW